MAATNTGLGRRANPSNFMNGPAIPSLEPAPSGGIVRGGMTPRAAAVVLSARPELAGNQIMSATTNAANAYRNATLLDIARASCEQSGIPTLYRSPAEVFSNALGTADFKQALAEIFVTGMTYGGAEVPNGILAITADPRQVTDFTQNKRTRYSTTGPGLQLKLEGAEFEYGNVGAAAETYAIGNFGRTWSLSLESMFATQDALPSVGVLAGRSVILHQREKVAKLLIDNANMSDSVPLFHASHGNVTSTFAHVDIDALDAARQLMRKQKDVETGQLIDVEPKYLVVPPEYETESEQLLAQLIAVTVDTQNPFQGKLQLVVEQNLPSGYAYVFASPTTFPVIERAFVSGSAAPDIQAWLDPTTDVFYNRVALRWGTGVVDYRGVVRIPVSG